MGGENEKVVGDVEPVSDAELIAQRQKERAKPGPMSPKRLAAILAQVNGVHPVHAKAVAAARAQADADNESPAQPEAEERHRPSKADRRAARRKDGEQ